MGRPTQIVEVKGQKMLDFLDRAGFTKRPLKARKEERRRRNAVAKQARKVNR